MYLFGKWTWLICTKMYNKFNFCRYICVDLHSNQVCLSDIRLQSLFMWWAALQAIPVEILDTFLDSSFSQWGKID